MIDPVPIEDTEVLGRGLRIDGHLGEVQSARHRGKGGLLTIVFDTVQLPSGEKLSILGSLTEIFASENGATPAVGPEGELKGKGPSRLKQAAIIAIPTAAVAAVAAPGPTIATGVGALVGTYILSKGKQATLSAGSLIGMRLDKDVTIKVPVTDTGLGQPRTFVPEGGLQPGAVVLCAFFRMPSSTPLTNSTESAPE
ncbi:MAG: hypothetical protein DMG21_08200 [Acidobacteria bacterium]|nr:MAG: hypothetical protein DMG21_08200 [Acidobacteriota bacterium]